MNLAIWLEGASRTGKTQSLVEEFRVWAIEQVKRRKKHLSSSLRASALILTANDETKQDLVDRMTTAVKGEYPVVAKTPIGFIRDEVKLFFPLIIKQLQLKQQFPIQLRPEMEQELAVRLWREKLNLMGLDEFSEGRVVRDLLDTIQLASAAEIPLENIAKRLEIALKDQVHPFSILGDNQWLIINDLLHDWYNWCLERGMITYGLIYELYGHYLLPNDYYQSQLIKRYNAIFADNLDDYPAITRKIFDILLTQKIKAVFTYNPNGQVKLGLNADPLYLKELAKVCHVKLLDKSISSSLYDQVGQDFISFLNQPFFYKALPSCLQTISGTTRLKMLENTAQFIIDQVKNNHVQPEDIVILIPGLDEIGKYTLLTLFQDANIPLKILNEQRPIITSPLVRALLTLLAFIYPNLGRLVDRSTIAEMLVVLGKEREIDPVCAGLLADACYVPNPDTPRLIPMKNYSQWDRLGYVTSELYSLICQWIEETKKEQDSLVIPEFYQVLEKAINFFFIDTNQTLSYEELSALRELKETAKHYWDAENRIRSTQNFKDGWIKSIERFILLLKRGTITANPYPVSRFISPSENYITLSNIYQYRSIRTSHKWQFWLDSSSAYWEEAGASRLFAWNIFQKNWDGQPLIFQDQLLETKEHVTRLVKDLLSRSTEKVFLCYSDFDINGRQQIGIFSNLLSAIP